MAYSMFHSRRNKMLASLAVSVAVYAVRPVPLGKVVVASMVLGLYSVVLASGSQPRSNFATSGPAIAGGWAAYSLISFSYFWEALPVGASYAVLVYNLVKITDAHRPLSDGGKPVCESCGAVIGMRSFVPFIVWFNRNCRECRRVATDSHPPQT